MTSGEIQRGAAPVDCNPTEQSSTICELSGILAGLTAIERVTLGRASGTITAGCDSARALSGIKHWTRTRKSTRRTQGGANYDLLREIRAVLKRLPKLMMIWLKVKAHLKRPPVSVHEVLNEEMDSLANLVHQSNRWQALTYAQSFGRAPVELLVNQRIVTQDAGAALQRAYHAPQMKLDVCKKHGWDGGHFDIIDWESFGTVNRNLDKLDRLQLFNMAHSALPVMRQQKTL